MPGMELDQTYPLEKYPMKKEDHPSTNMPTATEHYSGYVHGFPKSTNSPTKYQELKGRESQMETDQELTDVIRPDFETKSINIDPKGI